MLFAAPDAAAQAKQTPVTTTKPAVGTTPVPTSGPARLDITILPSRSQVTAGDGLAVVATLANKGDSTVSVSEADVALAVPPELLRDFEATTYHARFPTEPHDSTTPADSVIVRLRPGTTYPVYFTFGNPSEGKGSPWRPNLNFLEHIDFTPGKYQISVIVEYWTNNPKNTYTNSETALLDVAAPQEVVMFGAALGGLLAYLLFPLRRRTAESKQQQLTPGNELVQRYWLVWQPLRKQVWGAMTAAMWSALATILLARLSESQFIIQVSVVDFWGAITIGFIAQYAGAKWLERFAPTAGPQDDDGAAVTPGVGEVAQEPIGAGQTDKPTGGAPAVG